MWVFPTTALFSQTYLPLPEKSLLALRDQKSFYGIDKLGIPRLSCGLDKLDCIEVQKINQETFRDSNHDNSVFTPKTMREGTASSDHNSATDLQKAQKNYTWINRVLTWIRNQSLPPRSHQHGLPRNVWKLWKLFDELTIRHGIHCRKHETLKASRKVFQRIVPPALVQDKLYSVHPDHTSAHLVTKTIEKVPFRFYWPGHELDVDVFVASCFVKNATVPRRNITIVYEHGNPVFHSQRSVLTS